VRSVPGLYNEDQLPLPVSRERESAGRQLKVAVVRSEKPVAEAGTFWEHRGKGMSTVRSRYQAAHWRL
jgi:hypothetical protein